MKEEFKNSLEEYVALENSKLHPGRAKIETVRKTLEEEAKKIVRVYREEVTSLKPEASVRLQGVVLPWWLGFKGSGLYNQITDLLRTKVSFDLDLSEPVSYFYPLDVLRKGKEDKPYQSEAESITKRLTKGGGRLEEHLKCQVSLWNSDLWASGFCLTGYGASCHRFFIRQWSEIRQSWAFAIQAQWLQVAIDPSQEGSDLIDRIHPKVWIGFADQIEKGRVWQVLDESLRKNLRERD